MKKIAGILCLAVLVTACSGGGSHLNGSSPDVVPNAGAPTDSYSSRIAPAALVGGAHTVTITEHRLGSTPSTGGIAIANNGSIWTESNGTTNAASFVRWNNGIVTSYPMSDSNGSPAFTSSSLLAASGAHVFAFALQIADIVNQWLQGPFEVSSGGGAVTYLNNAGMFSGAGEYGYITALTSAKNGTVWEAKSYSTVGVSGVGYIAEVSPGNTSFQLPAQNTAPFAYDLPTALAQGPDGNLWVAVQNLENPGSASLNYNAMLVYSMSGNLLRTVKLESTANGIATGPDGAAWFTLQNGAIGRMTTAGTVRYFASRTTTALGGITVGSDGALWFLEPNVNRLGRISLTGLATDYAIPTANSKPNGIAGPANGCAPYTLWFAEGGSGKIAMVTYR